MKLVKSLAASAAMTLFLGAPVFLVGCSKSLEDICEDYGKACGETDAEIQECKDGLAKAEAQASTIGCSGEYDSFFDCAASNYETPSSSECSDNGNDPSDQCSAELTAYISCVQTKCEADPSKCSQ